MPAESHPPSRPVLDNGADPGNMVRSQVRSLLRHLVKRAVDARKGADTAKPDADLRRQVLDAMEFVLAFDPARVLITVAEGIVTLSG